ISFSASDILLFLHSFPTRRSSDLFHRAERIAGHNPFSRSAVARISAERPRPTKRAGEQTRRAGRTNFAARARAARIQSDAARARSEEHTSELQSPYDLVCRLLLEK